MNSTNKVETTAPVKNQNKNPTPTNKNYPTTHTSHPDQTQKMDPENVSLPDANSNIRSNTNINMQTLDENLDDDSTNLHDKQAMNNSANNNNPNNRNSNNGNSRPTGSVNNLPFWHSMKMKIIIIVLVVLVVIGGIIGIVMMNRPEIVTPEEITTIPSALENGPEQEDQEENLGALTSTFRPRPVNTTMASTTNETTEPTTQATTQTTAEETSPATEATTTTQIPTTTTQETQTTTAQETTQPTQPATTVQVTTTTLAPILVPEIPTSQNPETVITDLTNTTMADPFSEVTTSPIQPKDEITPTVPEEFEEMLPYSSIPWTQSDMTTVRPLVDQIVTDTMEEEKFASTLTLPTENTTNSQKNVLPEVTESPNFDEIIEKTTLNLPLLTEYPDLTPTPVTVETSSFIYETVWATESTNNRLDLVLTTSSLDQVEFFETTNGEITETFAGFLGNMTFTEAEEETTTTSTTESMTSTTSVKTTALKTTVEEINNTTTVTTQVSSSPATTIKVTTQPETTTKLVTTTQAPAVVNQSETTAQSINEETDQPGPTSSVSEILNPTTDVDPLSILITQPKAETTEKSIQSTVEIQDAETTQAVIITEAEVEETTNLFALPELITTAVSDLVLPEMTTSDPLSVFDGIEGPEILPTLSSDVSNNNNLADTNVQYSATEFPLNSLELTTAGLPDLPIDFTTGNPFDLLIGTTFNPLLDEMTTLGLNFWDIFPTEAASSVNSDL